MQKGNFNQRKTTEYYSYQRARRRDAEPITRKVYPLLLSAFLFNIYRQPAPPDGERKKTVAGQVDFVRSLYISQWRF